MSLAVFSPCVFRTNNQATTEEEMLERLRKVLTRGPRFSDARSFWGAGKGRRVTPRRRKVRNYYMGYVIQHIGDMMFAELRPDDLRLLQARLCDHGLRNGTVNAIVHGAVKAAFRDLGIDATSAFAGVERLPQSKKTTAAWSRREAQLILDVSRRSLAPDHAAFVHVAMHSGARIEELLALRWRNVLRDTSSIEIAGSRDPASGHETSGKTADSARIVPLPSRAMSAFEWCRQGHGDGFVFVTKMGSPLRMDYFRREHWAALMAALAGQVRPLPPRCTRHTYASLLLSSGLAGPLEVAKLLGNTPETVLQRYADYIGGNNGHKIQDALDGDWDAPSLRSGIEGAASTVADQNGTPIPVVRNGLHTLAQQAPAPTLDLVVS